MNYVRYHPGRPLHLPIVQVNQDESPALKRDGYLLPISRTVDCFVDEDAPNIPQAIEMECTGLQFKEVVRRDRLVLPPGVRFSDRVLKRRMSLSLPSSMGALVGVRTRMLVVMELAMKRRKNSS